MSWRHTAIDVDEGDETEERQNCFVYFFYFLVSLKNMIMSFSTCGTSCCRCIYHLDKAFKNLYYCFETMILDLIEWLVFLTLKLCDCF